MKKILIVDEEPVVLMRLSRLLCNRATAAVTSSRIEEAEEALSSHIFDLVIADMTMSGVLGLEGLELLAYIKRMSPQTEVILTASRGLGDIGRQACSRGAFHYYDRPIDVVDLASRVRDLGISIRVPKSKAAH
jgi:DNA-binding NtrC family response regulator